ncbi:hypothetical protein LX36DRAFT_663700 [Colletotrichum falcatum]|nr:hypothetical protein LX36DRAFT_663700 [Colletotrichum falcatum]
MIGTKTRPSSACGAEHFRSPITEGYLQARPTRNRTRIKHRPAPQLNRDQENVSHLRQGGPPSSSPRNPPTRALGAPIKPRFQRTLIISGLDAPVWSFSQRRNDESQGAVVPCSRGFSRHPSPFLPLMMERDSRTESRTLVAFCRFQSPEEETPSGPSRQEARQTQSRGLVQHGGSIRVTAAGPSETLRMGCCWDGRPCFSSSLNVFLGAPQTVRCSASVPGLLPSPPWLASDVDRLLLRSVEVGEQPAMGRMTDAAHGAGAGVM